jgi:hypothetical protein
LHVSSEVVCARNGTELLLPLTFGTRRFGGVTEERLLVGNDVIAEWRKREARSQQCCE